MDIALGIINFPVDSYVCVKTCIYTNEKRCSIRPMHIRPYYVYNWKQFNVLEVLCPQGLFSTYWCYTYHSFGNDGIFSKRQVIVDINQRLI